MIYICFPVYNRLNLTINCIESIKKSLYTDFKIVILDDGSSDGTTEYLKENYPLVQILHGDGSFFWAKGMNECLRYVIKQKPSQEDYVLMLNNDVEIQNDTLTSLLNTYKTLNYECIISCINLMIDKKELIENSGYYLKNYFIFKNFNFKFKHFQNISSIKDELIQVDSIAAKGAFMSTKTLHKLGFIDDIHFRQYHGDVIYFYKAKVKKIPIYISKNAKLFSYYYETGIAAPQHKNSYSKLLSSFFQFKSGNYFKYLYYRSLIINKSIFVAIIETITILLYKILKIKR